MSEDKQAEARREAARLLGSARTPKKAAAARLTARTRVQKGGRPYKALADIECNCGGGETLNHKATCFRGQAIKRRQAKGKPLVWHGEGLEG